MLHAAVAPPCPGVLPQAGEAGLASERHSEQLER